jgi:hypothetical protein
MFHCMWIHQMGLLCPNINENLPLYLHIYPSIHLPTFSSLSKIVCYPYFFLWWIHFILLTVWRPLQFFPKNPILYLTVFTLTHNPVSKSPNHNLKCFLSLHKIFISLYSPKYIYSRVGYLLFLLFSWLTQFFLTLLCCVFQSL